jgi:outer membrane receptor for ferrienterochelin and colicin
MSGFGGLRFEAETRVGRLSTDLSMRRHILKNKIDGDAGQATNDLRDKGLYKVAQYGNGLGAQQVNGSPQQTIGLTLNYSPTSWWSHTIVSGLDQTDTESRKLSRSFRDPGDTMLTIGVTHSQKRSLSYSSSLTVPLTSAAKAIITGGMDGWQSVSDYTYAQGKVLRGALGTGGYLVSGRTPDHNRGGYLTSQFTVLDKLVLTYGLRAEWNPAFGEDIEPNVTPTMGARINHDVGSTTISLRGAYGKATRPPLGDLKRSYRVTEAYGGYGNYLAQYFGDFDVYLANPDLEPEHSGGGEGGLEMYFGSRGSLVITRYNQTISKLIDAPFADSVPSLGVCLYCPASSNFRDDQGRGYIYQTKNLNIGAIRNQGWELGGTINLGPFSYNGTYSWTKSRFIKLDRRYSQRFDYYSYPQYAPGASFKGATEHTWASGFKFAQRNTSIALNVNGIGQAWISQTEFYALNLARDIRLQSDQALTTPSLYFNMSPSYVMADINASQRLSNKMEATLQIGNLTNLYHNDDHFQSPTIGRQTKFGLRIRL